MEEWKTYKIGDICESISDTYKGDAANVVLVNTSDVYDGVCLNHELAPNKDLKGQFKKTFKRNDILYSEIRPANKRFAFIDFEPENYIASTKLMVIRCSDLVRPRYLYHYLKRQEMLDELQGLAESRSGTFPQITFSELALFDISLPDLATQDKIVATVDCFEEKIALNNRINHNLLNIAQEIFDNKIVGSTSELGAFHFASLLDIADYLNGLAMQKFPTNDGEVGLPVLKIKELGQQECDANSDRCSEIIPEQYIINDGDIIFSWSGTLLVDFWCGGRCGLNQHLFKVSSENYPDWFIYFWTKHHLDRFIRIAKDKAVTMGHIKRGDLGKAEVIIPEESFMKTLDAEISPLISEYVKRRIENRKLQMLRDSLLPELISGQLIC